VRVVFEPWMISNWFFAKKEKRKRKAVPSTGDSFE
jgi:hypothetical protein